MPPATATGPDPQTPAGFALHSRPGKDSEGTRVQRAVRRKPLFMAYSVYLWPVTLESSTLQHGKG